MQIEYISQSRAVRITHKDLPPIEMPMQFYREGRRNEALLESVDPFRELNGYIAYKGEAFQEHVYNFYKKCQHIFDTVYDIAGMNDQLSNAIKELYEPFDFADISHYVTYYCIGKSISYPPSILNDINQFTDKSLITRERTYLKEDYHELICFIIALRLLAPIWSVYIPRIVSTYGVPWKEYYAYILIMRSQLAEHPALARLQRYIECTIEKSNDPNSAVLAGLSMEEYPVWLMAQALARRVIMGDITGNPNSPASLVVIVYKYVEQKALGNDKSFIGRVSVKRPPSEQKNDIDTMCVLETYNTRQDVADGYIEMFNVFLEDPYEIAHHLDPTIPRELVMESLSVGIPDLMAGEIKKGQLIINQWVLNKVVPARALEYVEKGALVNGMMAVRAYLWHKGLYSLAALGSALPVESGWELPLLASDRRSRVNKELLEELAKHFPYYRHVAGKTPNPVLNIMNTLASVTEHLVKDQWQLTIPKVWQDQGHILNNGQFYSAQEDVKLDLAQLAMLVSQEDPGYYQPGEELATRQSTPQQSTQVPTNLGI